MLQGRPPCGKATIGPRAISLDRLRRLSCEVSLPVSRLREPRDSMRRHVSHVREGGGEPTHGDRRAGVLVAGGVVGSEE